VICETYHSMKNDHVFTLYDFVGNFLRRLVIYPKGNAKDEGSGFISMYVEIDSTNLLSSPLTGVFAYLVFFVYNKKTDKYFTIKGLYISNIFHIYIDLLLVCFPFSIHSLLVFFTHRQFMHDVIDSELKRFNAFRTVWGLSQVLSLETFNDSKN